MQGLGDRAPVPKELPMQACGKACHGLVVVNVAWRHTPGQEFALVVDDERQCEAEKPPHRGLASGGEPLKDLVCGNAAIATHREGGASR